MNRGAMVVFCSSRAHAPDPMPPSKGGDVPVEWNCRLHGGWLQHWLMYTFDSEYWRKPNHLMGVLLIGVHLLCVFTLIQRPLLSESAVSIAIRLQQGNIAQIETVYSAVQVSSPASCVIRRRPADLSKSARPHDTHATGLCTIPDEN